MGLRGSNNPQESSTAAAAGVEAFDSVPELAVFLPFLPFFPFPPAAPAPPPPDLPLGASSRRRALRRTLL
jgi:hypothetical protein